MLLDDKIVRLPAVNGSGGNAIYAEMPVYVPVVVAPAALFVTYAPPVTVLYVNDALVAVSCVNVAFPLDIVAPVNVGLVRIGVAIVDPVPIVVVPVNVASRIVVFIKS